MKFLANLNINNNQLLNVVIEKRTGADGAGVDGQLIYRTDTDALKIHDGTSYVTIGAGGVSDGNKGDITVSGGGTTWTINNDAITTVKILNDAITTAKILNANITFAKIQNLNSMTVIGRTAGGSGVSSEVSILDEDNMVSNSATALATQQSIKAYIDNAIGGLGKLEGGWDAFSETSFPSTSVSAGDYWYITQAGVLTSATGTPSYHVGDVIIARINSPTNNVADWISLEVNREQATTAIVGVTRYATNGEAQGLTETGAALTPAGLASVTATETRTGIAELATVAETKALTDDARIVTPLKLAATKMVFADIGNGSATTITRNHNFNTRSVITYVFETASPFEQVFPDVRYTTLDTVDFIFAIAPTSNQYTAVVQLI